MSVRYYGQSWCKYRIRIGARVLICRDLHNQVVDGGGRGRRGWFDSHTGWTKTDLSIIQADQTNVPNKKFGWKLYSL